MKKKAVFIDFSGSVGVQLLRVFAGMALRLLDGGDEVYLLDAGGPVSVSLDRLTEIRDFDSSLWTNPEKLWGGGTPSEIPSDWEDQDKYLLTDGDVQSSLSICFDYIIVMKTPRTDVVRDVMFT